MRLPGILRTTPARIVVVVVLQTLMLAAIVADRALTLATGREIVVKTEPVDPHDLFRGDYIALSYAMSRLEVGRLEGDDSFSPGETVYVTLKREGDAWVPVAATHSLPPASPDTLVLRATTDYVYEAPGRPTALPSESLPEETVPPCPDPCRTLTLSYGIESYFVPEGQGRALEEERNAKRLSVVLAVRGDGRAAIKALMLDGKVIASEGLL